MIEMFDNYDEPIKLLMEWYSRAKQVAIIAESLDSFNQGYIQPLHEQRYCLDHFIRAIEYYRDDNVTNKGKEKIEKAFSSAIAHLQRCYSDSIEWILISVKDYYDQVLSQYDMETIQEVFPQYYAEIRPNIYKIIKTINRYKELKSVEEAISAEGDSNVDDVLRSHDKEVGFISNQLLSEEVVTTMCEYLDIINEKESALAEVKIKKQKKTFKDYILIPTIVGIVSAAVGGLLVAWIMG